MSRCVPFLLTAGAVGLGCNQPDPFASGGADTEYVPGDDDSGDEVELVCTPGELRCSADDSEVLEVCAGTGLEWEDTQCGMFQVCVPCDGGDDCTVDECRGPCETETEVPSSAGCSFLANRMLHPFEDEVDGLVVGNPNEDLTATVRLFRVPEGKYEEVQIGDPIELLPGTSTTFDLDASFLLSNFSLFRTGGNYLLQSDVPVIAYQHSPLDSQFGNDAAMLLPDSALGTDYVVASYTRVVDDDDLDTLQDRPSYFTVIGVENDTTVEWTPPVATHGNGVPLDQVAAGDTGVQILNRFDTMRIAAAEAMGGPEDTQDVSGTVIVADKPIWVAGGSACSRVPADFPDFIRGCDPLQELLIPINMWGERYAAVRNPPRGGAEEEHFWRVYAGADDVEVTLEPAVQGPFVLEKRGDFEEIRVPGGDSLIFDGDGPIMVVGYIQGQGKADPDGELGDPSMYQLPPVDQFLERYVFVTGNNYDVFYAQIIREAGGAPVFIDDTEVGGYMTLGEFEFADVEISQGPHLAESTGAFGLIQLAYRAPVMDARASSYAYPGGMKTETIYIP